VAAERNALLLEDNRKDERVLRQLEKNLKMKKRKSNSLPRAFVDDGLDCIFSLLTRAVLSYSARRYDLAICCSKMSCDAFLSEALYEAET